MRKNDRPGFYHDQSVKLSVEQVEMQFFVKNQNRAICKSSKMIDAGRLKVRYYLRIRLKTWQNRSRCDWKPDTGSE